MTAKFLHSLFLCACLALAGCSSSRPSVDAPSFLKGSAHHFRQEIPNCLRARGIPACGPKCSLKIKTVTTSQKIGRIPVFDHNGVKVGGYAKGTTVVIAVMPDNYYDPATLKHEICHVEDNCCTKIGGHPKSFKPCCPHWPKAYVSALEENLIECVIRVVNEEKIFVTILKDSQIDSQSLLENEWFTSLIEKCE